LTRTCVIIDIPLLPCSLAVQVRFEGLAYLPIQAHCYCFWNGRSLRPEYVVSYICEFTPERGYSQWFRLDSANSCDSAGPTVILHVEASDASAKTKSRSLIELCRTMLTYRLLEGVRHQLFDLATFAALSAMARPRYSTSAGDPPAMMLAPFSPDHCTSVLLQT